VRLDGHDADPGGVRARDVERRVADGDGLLGGPVGGAR